MQNILANAEISAAIYSTSQSAAGDVFGIQLSGKAVMLPDSEVEKAFQIYYARSPKAAVMKDNKPEKYKGSKVAWKFVKVYLQLLVNLHGLPVREFPVIGDYLRSFLQVLQLLAKKPVSY